MLRNNATSAKMGNQSSQNSWVEAYNGIRSLHDQAFHSIAAAIKLEEEEKPVEALEKYKEGISLIDTALRTPLTAPDHPTDEWERLGEIIRKLKRARAEALTRINQIQSTPGFEQPPPSYEEATTNTTTSSSSSVCSPLAGEGPKSYSELAKALRELDVDIQGEETVVFLHEDVRIYFIQPSGEVTSFQEGQTLKIAMIEQASSETPTSYYLQIGDWVYPLIAGVSPCYRTEFKAFIFPDVSSSVEGCCVGIIFPEDVDTSVYELLENILHGIVGRPVAVITQRIRREAPGISGRISSGLVNGAHYISMGLVKGAEKMGQLMNYGTPKLIDHMGPAAAEAQPIPPNVAKGFQIAEGVSSKAATVTGFVDKVGGATMALGRYLAPHIQRQGTRLLASSTHMSEQEASRRVGGVLTVAAGAVEGFATVYRGLETSASILGKNLSENTVKVVEHKYGQPAGTVTGNTLQTVGNLINVSHNIHYFKPKGVAKTMVKATGKAMVEEFRPPSTDNSVTNLPSTSNISK